MISREIHRTPEYERNVKQLNKKHRDIPKALEKQLEALCKENDPRADQIPGLNGLPVFKLRVAFGNVGKSGGARLIYYWNDGLVMGMFAYVKSERENIPTESILRALEDAGLMPSDEEPNSRPPS